MIDKCYKCANNNSDLCLKCSHNPKFSNHFKKLSSKKRNYRKGLNFNSHITKTKRNNDLKQDRESGMTYKQLGEKYGIHQQTARYIYLHNYAEVIK